MRSPLYILLILVMSMSCKPAQISLEEYKGEQLVLANGGGFTGQVIEYIVLENGAVFRKNSMDQSINRLADLKKDHVEQVFNNYEIMNLRNSRLDEPGNMYFYIAHFNGKDNHVIKWNAESSGSSVEPAKLFYQTVLNLLKQESIIK